MSLAILTKAASFMPRDIRIGIIGRADNTGLGVETWEFCRHFPEAKVMILDVGYPLFPQRFHNPTIVKDFPDTPVLSDFFKDIDLLFTIETPYNSAAYDIARQRGVKSVLRVNYEWLRPDYNPDFFIAPSLYHFDKIPGPKAYMPFPINREVLPFKLRKKARKFLHIAGNMKAAYDRNGTQLLIEAQKYIKSDAEIIIKSQLDHDYENYWEIWEDADVYVSPRRYAGQSLPLNEAMSRGMAIMMTNMEPQNQFLPQELLFRPSHISKFRINKEIEIADIDPEEIARKIDSLYNKNITEYSEISDHIADQWSWKTLKPKYQEIFEAI
jgi:hypothetical protein